MARASGRAGGGWIAECSRRRCPPLCNIPYGRSRRTWSGGWSVEVIDPTVDGDHGSLIPTTSSLGQPSPYKLSENALSGLGTLARYPAALSVSTLHASSSRRANGLTFYHENRGPLLESIRKRPLRPRNAWKNRGSATFSDSFLRVPGSPIPRRNLEVVYAVPGTTCDFLRVTSLIDSPGLRLLRVDELTDSSVNPRRKPPRQRLKNPATTSMPPIPHAGGCQLLHKHPRAGGGR